MFMYYTNLADQVVSYATNDKAKDAMDILHSNQSIKLNKEQIVELVCEIERLNKELDKLYLTKARAISAAVTNATHKSDEETKQLKSEILRLKASLKQYAKPEKYESSISDYILHSKDRT